MTNNTLQIILTVIGILGSIGLLAGGIGFLWGKIKGGTKEAKAESSELLSSNDQIKEFYKEQNNELKVIIQEKDAAATKKDQDWNDKFQAVNRELGEVKGQLSAANANNERLEKIFQRSDPETKQFMEYMIQATKDQSQAMKDQSESHKEMVRVLGEIHTMSKMEHDRDFQITSTVSKT